ncbi:MAG: hypothetical protein NTX25_02545 [Proteobacteria bacterium]|nr:hypothetical protein [Pseudomonadota bacterium]
MNSKNPKGKVQAKKKGMSPWVFVVPFAVGLAYFFQHWLAANKKLSAQDPVPTPAHLNEDAGETKLKIIPVKKANPQKIAAVAALSAVGLQELAPSIDKDGHTLFAVRFKAQAACRPGDFEALEKVFGSSGSLLLSIEPMQNDSKIGINPVSKLISMSDLYNETLIYLPVRLDVSGVYGIYLCGDSDGTKTCRNKEAIEYSEVYQKDKLDKALKAVYYYQFTVIGLEYPTIYNGTQKGFANASELIKKKKSEIDWTPQLDAASLMMQGVQSLPPSIALEGDKMVLELRMSRIMTEKCF